MGTAIQEEAGDFWLAIAEKVDEALADLATPDNLKVRELVSSKIGCLVIEHVELLLHKTRSPMAVVVSPDKDFIDQINARFLDGQFNLPLQELKVK